MRRSPEPTKPSLEFLQHFAELQNKVPTVESLQKDLKRAKNVTEIYECILVGILNRVDKKHPGIQNAIAKSLQNYGLAGEQPLTSSVYLDIGISGGYESYLERAKKYKTSLDFPKKSKKGLSVSDYQNFLLASYIVDYLILKTIPTKTPTKQKKKWVSETMRKVFGEKIPFYIYFPIFSQYNLEGSDSIHSKKHGEVPTKFRLSKDFFDQFDRKLELWLSKDSLPNHQIRDKICAYLCKIAEGDSFRKYLRKASKDYPTGEIIAIHSFNRFKEALETKS